MGLPAFQHPLLSPPAATTLCSRIRLTACMLGICHPRFLCSGAKQTRNSHRPHFHVPSPPTLCSPTPPSLPSAPTVTLHDRALVQPFPFLRVIPPGLLHALMCDLIKSFFRPTRRLLNCLARCVSLRPVNSAPGKIPLRYMLLHTARKCIRLVTR